MTVRWWPLLAAVLMTACAAGIEPPSTVIQVVATPTPIRLTPRSSPTAILPTATATALPPTTTATATALPPTPEPTGEVEPELAEPASSAGAPVSTIVSTPLPGDGSQQPIGQHAYSIDVSFIDVNGLTRTHTISYLLYLPQMYGQEPQQQWPLILFLHGSDVWGNDPAALTASGLPARLASATDFPAIVLSPQVPEDVVWWGAELDRVNALLDHIEATYTVDAQREYLTGLSMGGFGVWAMAIRYPQRFAALVPVAGGWNSENDTVPRTICDLKDTPTWIFHGEQDDIVPARKAQLMIEALKRCGVEPRVTLYADANHRESFERAYADPELYVWLFEQRRP